MCKYYYTAFFLGISLLTLTSCEQRIASREYDEIVTTASSLQIPFMRGDQRMQEILDASVARPSLSWETPGGWSEEKGSGMRLVTFRDSNSLIECSIISLGGQAGGLQSNVSRWMNQISVNVPDKDQFKELLSRQIVLKTKGGFSITVIDLSEFTQDQQLPSMIGAIAELEDKTIFVKMTGSRDDVVANREQFTSLCRSLAL